jgi:hypothetical protein
VPGVPPLACPERKDALRRLRPILHHRLGKLIIRQSRIKFVLDQILNH